MNQNEDNEILDSIATAEKMLHTKMGTPQKVKGQSWEPVKYDVEQGLVQKHNAPVAN
jgi:hypothetical protein